MKNIIKSFKKVIRFMVSIFASREFAFIYCLVGTVAQVTHTYFLTESISSFSGGFKVAQAILISFFISSSLLYFVAIADETKDDDGKRTKESKRVFWAINIFMVIEILINFYYYSRHLIIDSPKLQLFDFIFAVLVSGLIPITIKLYANSIRAKEWLTEFEEIKSIEEKQVIPLVDVEELVISESEKNFDKWLEKNNLDKSLPENFESTLNHKFDQYLLNIKTDELLSEEQINSIMEKFSSKLDPQISQIFAKNQSLFLQQFENKCKVLINKNIDTLKTKPLLTETETVTSEK